MRSRTLFATPTNISHSAFTLVELLVAVAVFSIFGTVLLSTWTSLQTNAMNTTTYALRQNDQMRVMDYIKRDIRRASAVAIYNGATLVTTANTYGSTLQLTIPGYYNDTRAEDDSHGTSTANAPTYSSGLLSYGTSMTIQYYVLNGAVIRSEAGTARTIADTNGAFTLSFCSTSANFIRTQITFSQRLRSFNDRNLARTLNFLTYNHTKFAK